MVKCNLFPIVFIAFLTACTSYVEDVFEDRVADSDIVFHAKMVGETESKTYLDEFGSVVRWHAEDMVSVLLNSDNRKYRFDGATGDLEGYFLPYEGFSGSAEPLSTLTKSSVEAPSKVYLVYPYNENNAVNLSTDVVTMSLPDVQGYDSCGFVQNVFPMIATTDVSGITPGTHAIVDVFFKNAASILGIKLFGSDSIKTIIFKGNNGEKIAGTVQATVDESGIPHMSMTSDAEEEITLDCGGGVRLQPLSNQISTFWFVVPPIEFTAGFTVKVINSRGDTLTKATSNSLKFERSKKMTMAPFEMSVSTKPTITSISISNGTKTFLPFMTSDSVSHFMAEHSDNLSSMVATFTHNGRSITVSGVNQESGVTVNDYSDFANPIVYDIESSIGVRCHVKANFYDLPVLAINTPNGQEITSKDVRLEGCTVTLYDTDGSIINLGTAGIKGRGNSTWQRSKKPYNVKLDSKKNILGINQGKKSKKWTLLANDYYDKTHLHNDVSFKMAQHTDYPWVQSGEYVELILNGVHQGNYYLTQKPDIEKNKIDINEDEGILIESAMANVSSTIFSTDYFNKSGGFSLHWFIDSPEEWAVSKRDSVRTMLNHMESLIDNADSLAAGIYRNYYDIETSINWFLIEELAQNDEARRSKNVVMYLDKDSVKFVMGPPWDFDAYTFHSPNWTALNIKRDAMYYSALCGDPFYVNRLKAKWLEYSPVWADMAADNGYIDQRYEQIHRSAERDIVMHPDWASPDDTCTYAESVRRMKVAILGRISIMDNLINAL